MSIYTEELVEELESLVEYADLLLPKFDAGAAAAELLADVDTLGHRLESAAKLSPEGLLGEWGRKIYFLNYYLKRGELLNCRADIVELSNDILPKAIEKLKELGSASIYLDPELRDAIIPLLRVQQFSSAIRQAFVMLTERMRKRFELPSGVDGAVMVNAIFGSSSEYLPGLTNSERQARRDYIAGLYAVLRNKYAHSDPPLDPVELEATLAGVNLALKLIG